MKKKMLGGLAVLAIAVVAAFNVNVNMQEEGISSISLENVEALASESRYGWYDPYKNDCISSGGISACGYDHGW